MNLFQNTFFIENIASLISAGFLAFIVAFLLTPLIGRLAKAIGAVDLPKSLRSSKERGFNTRVGHTTAMPRLGGLAMFIGIAFALLATNSLEFLPRGIIIGALIIVIGGILDDTFEIDGKFQIIIQILAALVVIVSGISITEINFLGSSISFNLFSASIEVLGYIYNFIFPADLLTLLWILGLINVINWVGGVDGLNASVTSIAALTMLLFALASGNIPLAIIIAIHVGGVLGVFPFNYNPAKIYYGLGDYLNGYLLAVFAILGGTRWTATLILLGMPIIDGLLVVLSRIKNNPKLLRKPWEILGVSDTSHLHHRLIDAGYSRKTVMLIEIALMLILCSIAIYFSDIRDDVTAFVIGMSSLFVAFALITFLKRRHERNRSVKENLLALQKDSQAPIGDVKVIYQEDPSEEKFKY